MKRLVFTLIFLSPLLLFWSCSTDVNVLEKWKETAVVYGLLNPSDSVQYIRINKAFLGDGNAIVMAKESDSIYYPDELNVALEQWKNGTKIKTLVLQRDSSIAKLPGEFANDRNILYRTLTGDSIKQDESEYHLTIINTRTGNTVQAATPIVQSMGSPSVASYPSINFVNNFTLKWYSAKNGRVYGLTVRFHYREVNLTNSDTTDRYLDWVFPSMKSLKLEGGELFEMVIEKESFFQFVGNHLSPDPNVVRLIGKIDFIFTSGADDLSTYIDINQPSTGLVQEKPLYSNLDNGIGLFSSRYIQYVLNKPLSTTPPYSSVDSLKNGRFTSALGFQ